MRLARQAAPDGRAFHQTASPLSVALVFGAFGPFGPFTRGSEAQRFAPCTCGWEACNPRSGLVRIAPELPEPPARRVPFRRAAGGRGRR